MKIHVNGQPHEVPAGATLDRLLSDLDVNQSHIAVELNLEVVPRAVHADTVLHDGDHLEVVTLVGGG